MSNSPKFWQIKFQTKSQGRHIHYENQRLRISTDTKCCFKRRFLREKRCMRHDVTKWRHIDKIPTDLESTRQDLWFAVLHDRASAIWKFDPRVNFWTLFENQSTMTIATKNEWAERLTISYISPKFQGDPIKAIKNKGFVIPWNWQQIDLDLWPLTSTFMTWSDYCLVLSIYAHVEWWSLIEKWRSNFLRHDVIKWRHIDKISTDRESTHQYLSFEVLHDRVSVKWKFKPRVNFSDLGRKPKFNADRHQKLMSSVLDHKLYSLQISGWSDLSYATNKRFGHPVKYSRKLTMTFDLDLNG